MNVAEFISKWRRSERTERSAAQEHFLDLCEVVSHPKPGEVHPAGEWFTFERGATKENGGRGWADFIKLPHEMLPANLVIVFARDDDYFFGVLHSRIHEVWARSQGTQLREKESGFRYTPTTCFETFPFPEPTPGEEAEIASAARALDELRSRWLNPPEWTRTETLEFPGTTSGAWARYVEAADATGLGTVRYPRTVARDEECARLLSKRTLTSLYNQRPAWLDLAHRRLDAAVASAYHLDPGLPDSDILAHLLKLNRDRAAK